MAGKARSRGTPVQPTRYDDDTPGATVQVVEEQGLVLGRKRDREPERTVLVFRTASYDDAGVETLTDWRMPAKPRPAMAFTFLRTARREGHTYAMQELMEAMLGEGAYEALIAADPDDEELAAVSQRIVDALLGRGASGN